MVKHRAPGTFAGAIAKLMETVGYGRLSGWLDVSKSQLFRFSDEDEPQLPRIDVAVQMDIIADRHGLGWPIYEAYGAKLQEAGRAAHEPREPLEAITETIRECSEAVTAFRQAHVKPSPAAIRIAMKEVAEARDAYDAMLRDLEAMLPPEPRMVGAERNG